MAVYLIRHGSAGHALDDPDLNAARVLDPRGQAQAIAIQQALAERTIQRVISSPALRCTQTVERLASHLDLPIDIDHAFEEGTPIDRSWAALEAHLATAQHLVISSHGDIIPDLINRAANRGMAVRSKAGCSKGSIWELHYDGERFTEGTYHSMKSGQ